MDTPLSTGTDMVAAPDAGLPAALPVVQDAQPTSLLTAIVQMARDPQVDVGKLDALLNMQAKMEERQAEREFIAAFTTMTRDLPRVKKSGVIDLGPDKAGKARTVAFARWEDMDTVIRPKLVENGFTLSFNSAPRDGGGLIVTGELMHRSGHVRTASIALPLDTGPGRNNTQAVGSTLSYGKRYCAEMLLNIVREGDDDDGVKGGVAYITPEQCEELSKLIADTGADEQKFLQAAGAMHLAEIPQGAFTMAKNLLLQKQRKKAS